MELWDVYDINRNKKGYTIEREKSNFKENEYHIVVHIWLINSNNQFLIQRRSLKKGEGENSWAATGGSILVGETSIEGAIRETYEEIGIKLEPNELELIMEIKPNGLKNPYFTDVYLVRKDINLEDCILDEEEVADIKYLNLAEIHEMLDRNHFWKYHLRYPKYFEIIKSTQR